MESRANNPKSAHQSPMLKKQMIKSSFFPFGKFMSLIYCTELDVYEFPTLSLSKADRRVVLSRKD